MASACRDPRRTCIGCRQIAPQSTLIRVVGTHRDGTWHAVIDHARRLPGRGAWIHCDYKCTARAIKRRAVNQALRKPGEVNITELVEWLGTL